MSDAECSPEPVGAAMLGQGLAVNSAGAVLCYYLTGLLPALGVILGYSLFPDGMNIPYGEENLLLRFAAWDGGQYMEVATDGYSHDTTRASNIAFFPAYPLLGRVVMRLTGWPIAVSLLAVSHLMLVCSFILLRQYVARRYPEQQARLGPAVLLTFGLFPTTFFFRMAYSEALFLLLCLCVLYGIQQRWPILWLAILTGLATATRPVGVALLLPLSLYLLRAPGSVRRKCARFGYALPLGVWGLVAFMVYQWAQFGDPLVFECNVVAGCRGSCGSA